MSINTKQALPAWAFPTSIALGVLLLVFIAWRTFAGGDAETGPSKTVRPNSFDMRAEARKSQENESKNPDSQTTPQRPNSF